MMRFPRWIWGVVLFFVSVTLGFGATATVSSGSFYLVSGGTITGVERFEIAKAPDGFRLSAAGSRIASSGKARWEATARFAPDLSPLEYVFSAETPQATIRVEATLNPGDGTWRVVRRLDDRPSPAELFRGSNWVLLDKDVMSLYAVLALRLWAAGGGEFTALVPQARAALPLSAVPDGLAAFQASWGDEVAQRWRLSLGGEAVLLYEHAGELLWAEVPRLGLSAWRADLFPELPKPYRIQTEMSLPSGALEEKVRFPSNGIELAGTLLLPPGEGQLPAVLFIPGTGAVDWDGSAPETPAKIFRELAYSLAEAGIASLRYDKRGVGESEGDLPRASFTDLLADARAALVFLKGRPEIGRVFLVGHSAGALQALLLAQEGGVAGLILLGVPAKPLREVLRWQMEQALRAAGAPEERVSRELAKLAEFVSFAGGSSGDWDDYTAEELREALPDYSPEEIDRMRTTSLRWWREALAVDPLISIREAKVPVLIVNGGADIRVPPGDAIALAEMARAAGNPDARGETIPKMNHWLRFQPGRPFPELVSGPLDPRAVQLILDWLSQQIRG